MLLFTNEHYIYMVPLIVTRRMGKIELTIKYILVIITTVLQNELLVAEHIDA